MAYSPCPECQNSAEFDRAFREHAPSRACTLVGYIVVTADLDGSNLRYQCNKVKHHNWRDGFDLNAALHRAGYGAERGSSPAWTSDNLSLR